MAYFEGSKSLEQAEEWLDSEIQNLNLSICDGELQRE